ncbi:hypothetical protein KAJ87_03100 [Candidatus Pacearchaeota archaeon]|nr:hypothetical protein [Candidatus Pacearchaeota archaeon]
MKFSEKEIVVGIIFFILIVALLFNIFWADPINAKFCGDGICSDNEFRVCKLDCSWCGDGSCNVQECDLGCTEDCSPSQCENRICESEKGENCVNTPNDCKCNEDYVCDRKLEQCVKDSCGNGICESHEYSLICPNDCKGEVYQEEDLSDINYPIIFVHGHSQKEVKGYSPTELEEFQDKLLEENYEDKGMVLPGDYPPLLSEGVWSKKKISVIMTYYADKYDSLGGIIGDADNQHIDVYSQRLGDVVKVVRHNTGKNKVIIIAHSMGGLVSRNYIKNHGGLNSVDKLVTIGTPNHGTYGYIGSLCGTIIAGRNPTPECEDMKSGSDFLINLNNEDETPGNIGYLTIIAKNKIESSCSQGDYWDNVICASSVYLEGAENWYYEDFSEEYYTLNLLKTPRSNSLHVSIVKPAEHPEVYNKIINFVKG